MSRRFGWLLAAALGVGGGYLALSTPATVSAQGVPSVAGARGRAPKPSGGGSAGPNFAFVDAGSEHIANDLSVGGSINLPSASFYNSTDTAGAGYWSLGNNFAALGNVNALGIFRTGGSTPYFYWDLNTGYAVSRFGITIAGGNDGSDQRGAVVELSHDGGTAFQYLEHDRDVFSGGTKTIVFKHAFSVAPDCFCSDGTALAACDVPTATVTTSQAVFNGTGTDKFAWQCIGDR